MYHSISVISRWSAAVCFKFWTCPCGKKCFIWWCTSRFHSQQLTRRHSAHCLNRLCIYTHSYGLSIWPVHMASFAGKTSNQECLFPCGEALWCTWNANSTTASSRCTACLYPWDLENAQEICMCGWSLHALTKSLLEISDCTLCVL